MDASLFILAVTALVFVLAGFVKGVIGLGIPTVSMGLLVLLMPPARAAALLVVPSLVTNVWQMATGPGLRPITKRLWAMMVGICVGTWAAAGRLSLSENAATALGLALILYAISGLVS